MNEMPETPVQAARMLWEIDEEIKQRTAELKALRRRMPQLMRDRRMAYARVYLSTVGTETFRKQSAEVAAQRERLAEDAARQEIATVQELLQELRDRSKDLRSINSNLKEELRVLRGTT